MANTAWSLEHDEHLWSQLGHVRLTPSGGLSGADREVASLAQHYNRTDGAIRSRMKHLHDPEHSAYKRLFGGLRESKPKTQSSSSRRERSSSDSLRRETPPPESLATSSRHIIDLADSSDEAGAGAPAASHGAPSRGAHASSGARAPSGAPSSDARLAAPAPPEAGLLNSGQRRALALVLAGYSLFLTGAAGTGKSFCLRSIIAALEAREGAGSVAVTAPTGIAATHIGGMTIHSWSGIGLGKGGADALVSRVLHSAPAVERWRAARTLVIDEVSMLDGVLFDALDAIGRAARGQPSLAFGGMQLLLCGDFFQLPPIFMPAGFAFQAGAWDDCSMRVCVLHEVVRQQGDGDFVEMLNELRVGYCSPATTAALARCAVGRKAAPSDGIHPTRLYCKNQDVDEENSAHLRALPGTPSVFPARDVWARPPEGRDAERALSTYLDKKAPARLELKLGAQVSMVGLAVICRVQSAACLCILFMMMPEAMC